VQGGEIADRPITELLRQHLTRITIGCVDVPAVETGGDGLIELEEMERRAVDAGEKPRRPQARSGQARQPIRTAKGRIRPMQNHMLINPLREAMNRLRDVVGQSRREADRIRSIADLRGMRVGIGPIGSGSEHVARQVMAQLAELDIKVSTQPLQEQLAMLERGELDLGAMVMAPDSQLMMQAVRDRKLQIVDISAADALASRLPSARGGVIKAGNYDPVRQLPPTNKRIIEIDTLVIGNGCARESVTQGMISALVRVFPTFVSVNRERANLTGLEYASAARSYLDRQGPDTVGEYVPWFIDIMPTARWVQLVFAFSLLFGAQAAWHRFRLWRLDAGRVEIEDEVSHLFAPGVTVAEIAAAEPEARHRTPEARAKLDAMVNELGRLAERCRRQSLSMLVPMGQEMSYRYQERLIAELLHALRQFRRRLER